MEDYKIHVTLGLMPTLGADILYLNSRVVVARGSSCTFDRVNLTPKLEYFHKVIQEEPETTAQTFIGSANATAVEKSTPGETPYDMLDIATQETNPATLDTLDVEPESYCREVIMFLYIMFIITLFVLTISIKCCERGDTGYRGVDSVDYDDEDSAG